MRITPKTGLGFVLSPIFCILLLSALGFRSHTIWTAAAFSLLPILFGALAWTHQVRLRRDFRTLTYQRNALIACLALLLSIPLTRWPLWLAIYSTSNQLDLLATDTLVQRQKEFDETAKRMAGGCGNWIHFFDRYAGSPARWFGLLHVNLVRVDKSHDEEILVYYTLASSIRIVRTIQPNQRYWTIEE
ncbi:hypothetical protein [Armatimonas sp.]|uniref:hypothetical protein n=1 Tax=Armatimonas sp. TaxID=1872638 RepID=UPI00286B2D28|nr:hypothetical protein [Armatimonas sp.]